MDGECNAETGRCVKCGSCGTRPPGWSCDTYLSSGEGDYVAYTCAGSFKPFSVFCIAYLLHVLRVYCVAIVSNLSATRSRADEMPPSLQMLAAMPFAPNISVSWKYREP